MQTDNIKQFLATAYSDEQLAALLCHVEDGKFSYMSCSCLIGIPLSPHGLFTEGQYCRSLTDGESHVSKAKELPFGREAELEYAHLSIYDSERREILKPIILEEIARREALKAEAYPVDQGDEQPEEVEPEWSDSDTHSEMEHSRFGYR